MLDFGDVVGIISILFFFFLFKWGFRLLFGIACAAVVKNFKNFKNKGKDLLKQKFEEETDYA